jgi:uncharacterized protein YjiS (DUF1127 family)
MKKIRHETNRIAKWLNRAASRRELTSLSDRTLRDIGVARSYPRAEACRPFWMA